MTDPHQSEPSAGEQDSAWEKARGENQVGEGAAPEASSAEAPQDEAQQDEAQQDEAQQDEAQQDEVTGEGAPGAPEKERRKGVLLGVGGAVLAVAALALVLAAFAWPGFLAGPGTPDDTATRAVAALASKDPVEVDKVSCRGPDGNAVSQLPPEALQVIQGATQTGAPQLLLDTQAQAPINLTLSAQGQTQDIAADVMLGVTDDEWCMTGIAQQQPPSQQQPPAGG
jgi:hypothetical protein